MFLEQRVMSLLNLLVQISYTWYTLGVAGYESLTYLWINDLRSRLSTGGGQDLQDLVAYRFLLSFVLC